MIHATTRELAAGNDLSRADADAAMTEMLAGRADDSQIVSFLSALGAKGETVEELVGFASAMRRHAVRIYPPEHKRPTRMLVDTCGTGGDARGTFNISTTTAFVVAGAGAHVAKHGNRSISSQCGSADVLEALGVNIHLPPERVGEAIERVGIGFLFAPALHTSMKHAMNARSALRTRTVFNLLGPLTNPAGASTQLLGVYEEAATSLLARALAELGSTRAFVVHGADGLDEISLSGETHVAELRNGVVTTYTIVPEDFGLPRAPLEAMAGRDAKTNARILRRVLDGEFGPHREIVQANAAAALVAAGRATDFLDGVRLAAQSIDSGAAQKKLDALVAFTNEGKIENRK